MEVELVVVALGEETTTSRSLKMVDVLELGGLSGCVMK